MTNHGLILLVLHRDPYLRQRDIARLVGITEGAVHRILSDLQLTGHVRVERLGRRNRYSIDTSQGLCHPLEPDRGVARMLDRLS